MTVVARAPCALEVRLACCGATEESALLHHGTAAFRPAPTFDRAVDSFPPQEVAKRIRVPRSDAPRCRSRFCLSKRSKIYRYGRVDDSTYNRSMNTLKCLREAYVESVILQVGDGIFLGDLLRGRRLITRETGRCVQIRILASRALLSCTAQMDNGSSLSSVAWKKTSKARAYIRSIHTSFDISKNHNVTRTKVKCSLNPDPALPPPAREAGATGAVDTAHSPEDRSTVIPGISSNPSFQYLNQAELHIPSCFVVAGLQPTDILPPIP